MCRLRIEMRAMRQTLVGRAGKQARGRHVTCRSWARGVQPQHRALRHGVPRQGVLEVEGARRTGPRALWVPSCHGSMQGPDQSLLLSEQGRQARGTKQRRSGNNKLVHLSLFLADFQRFSLCVGWQFP